MKGAVAPLMMDPQHEARREDHIKSPLLQSDDPLLKQLPQELMEFVRLPREDQRCVSLS